MLIVYIVLSVLGLGGSVASGIFYGKSFTFDDYGEGGKEFSANPDYMILLVLSLFLLALGVIGIIAERKKTPLNGSTTLLGISSILTISFIYALARTIRAMVKGQDATWYLAWSIVGFVLACGAIAAFLVCFKKKKK